MEKYRIAIIGAGPAGLSAAARAAELEVSHVLLEATARLADTAQRYHKGKFVMAEPDALPLRSSIPFQPGSREEVLSEWGQSVQRAGVNVQYEREVTRIHGAKGNFSIAMKNGDFVEAENVVVAIGVQGNPRKLKIPGHNLPGAQYTLDDPGEHKDQTIVVVGAGDAAIENALALADRNTVYIINRRQEFARAREANNTLILRGIDEGLVECFYRSAPSRLEKSDKGDKPYRLTLTTETGEAGVPCDRIIARLGAAPQRELLESFGIELADYGRDALPVLSEGLESSIPGLYVVGSLTGNPLIKQAMNQGYEVVERILGNPIEPVEYQVLSEKLSVLPFAEDVGGFLQLIRERVALFSMINPLQLREMMVDSQMEAPGAGEVIFSRNDESKTLYAVVSGYVEVRLDKGIQCTEAGQVFGEQGLIPGRRRAATAVAGEECALVEIPRRILVKLIDSSESIARYVEELLLARAIQQSFELYGFEEQLRGLARLSQRNLYKAGGYIYKEGDPGDSCHLVRTGLVTLSREIRGREVIWEYVRPGNLIGESGLYNRKRAESARASVRTETVSIDKDCFLQVLETNFELRERVRERVEALTLRETELASRPPLTLRRAERKTKASIDTRPAIAEPHFAPGSGSAEDLPPGKPVLDDDVQFTVYRPRVVRPEQWYDMLAFVHLGTPPSDESRPDPVREVKRKARATLGRQVEEYRSSTEDSAVAVPREGEICFVPEAPGIVFNPPRRSFLWLEDVHQEEFRLRASGDMDGRTAKGRLTVFMGSIILAEVTLSIRVDSSAGIKNADPTAVETAAGYRKIFASYSHKDLPIVEEVERYARATGDAYLRDWTELRAGQQWNRRLEEMIEEADIFQLFWSTNSCSSPFVRQEWHFALGLYRPNFIRPTYWERPIPDPPPELGDLHFQELPIAVGAPRSEPSTGSGQSRETGPRDRSDPDQEASSPSAEQSENKKRHAWYEHETPNMTQKVQFSDLRDQFATGATEVVRGVQNVEMPSLIGTSGNWSGHIIKLDKEAMTIGRSGTDIVLDEPSVSTKHAQIVRDGERWKVVDLMSANGIYVNGKKTQVAFLSSGDAVRFGQLELRFVTDSTTIASRTVGAETAPPPADVFPAAKSSWRWLYVAAGAGIAAAAVYSLYALYN